MGQLIYSMIASLDGYIADETGNFDWAMPSAEAHTFINEKQRGMGTLLYGRNLYELMQYWESDDAVASGAPEEIDFAAGWKAARKIVYSRTLAEVSTSRTELRRAFDADEVRGLKRASDSDLCIGGPNLAEHAWREGLVDEVELYLAPVIVGAGNRVLPARFRQRLELLDERRFDDGMMYLRYAVGARG